MLEMKEISFGYNTICPVLHNISMTIKAGEFIAIAGRNGSGKTTATRLMMALRKPASGTMLLHGNNTASATPADMARHIGYVFQNPDRQMFRDTVASEVAYGPEQLGFTEQERAAAVEQALRLTGLTDLAEAYPMTLSKGRKQRVAIASALAMKPTMLILDEPTSGQDCRERQRLLELLTQLNKQGMTIVIITHDMELVARYANRVIVMAEGEIVFDGTARHLFEGNQPLAKWGLVAATDNISPEILSDNISAAVTAKTAPLTKLLFTLVVSIWSVLLSTIPALASLVMIQMVLLALGGQLRRTAKAIGVLTLFAVILTGLQYVFGSGLELAVVTGLRMISMTMVFLLLLSTTSMQHLTAALVRQCRVPNEYAFMFTAALRFVPDFLAESKAVREAQACRGYQNKGNIIARMTSYVALIEPLVLRAVSRSETMALSLALRGFGSKNRSFSTDVALGSRDYGLLAIMGIITMVLVVMKIR